MIRTIGRMTVWGMAILAVGLGGPPRTARADSFIEGYEGDARRIIELVGRRYEAIKTYSDAYELTMSSDLPELLREADAPSAETPSAATRPAPRSETVRGRLVIERPARFMLDTPTARVFSDGKRIVTHEKETGQIMTTDVPMSRGQPDLSDMKGPLRETLVADPHLAWFLTDDLAREMISKVELIKLDQPAVVDGATCHVLHMRYSVVDVTYYVDQKTHLIRRMVTDFRRRVNALLGEGANTEESKVTLTVKSPTVNATYAPETFEYTADAAAAIEPTVKVLKEAPPLGLLKSTETKPDTQPAGRAREGR